MQKITPHLWFDKEAKEAADLYTSIFKDPLSLAMVVRANLEISEKPVGDKRMIFSGTIDQIKEDIAGCNDIGAHELFFDPTFSPGAQSLDRWLALMEQLRKLRRGLQARAGHRAQDFRLSWLSGVICGGTSHSLFLNPGFSESASSKCASVAPGRYCGLLPACSRSGGPTR